MKTILPSKIRYFLGFITQKTVILKHTSPFKYWKHFYYIRKYGEDNKKYWTEYGKLVLESMETTGYEQKVDFNYIEKIVSIAKNNISRKNDFITELGGGYFRNILILSQKLEKYRFYNIDFAQGIEEKLEEIDNQRIKFFRTSVTKTENYLDILQNSKIIFTYGLFMYLNENETLKLLTEINKTVKPETYIIIVEPGQILNEQNELNKCETLKKSVRRKTGTFIHNYPELFKSAGMYIENKSYNTKNINIFLTGKTK